MRFLDGDTKRSRVSSSGFRPVWDLQSEPVASDSNEFASPIDAGYDLMKLAGKALFRRVREILGEHAEEKAVAIFVGGGNNGGDGLALASNLIEAGIPCTVY
jgi:NAD(P)H-hydrate epimerase